MKSTKNYSIFNDITSNREVDPKHLNKLIKSIRERNLLYANPILVSKNMAVVDGQHRLEAAKKLELEIFYIVADVNHRDISKLNSHQKNWRLSDYINFFTINKVPEFIEFSKFANQHDKFALVSLLCLCNPNNTRSTKDIKDGFLDIDDMENALYIINIINNLYEEFHTDFVFDNAFPSALKAAVKLQNFNVNVFLEKIRQAPREFVPCRNKKDYLKMIQDIYNYKLSSNRIVLVA